MNDDIEKRLQYTAAIAIVAYIGVVILSHRLSKAFALIEAVHDELHERTGTAQQWPPPQPSKSATIRVLTPKVAPARTVGDYEYAALSLDPNDEALRETARAMDEGGIKPYRGACVEEHPGLLPEGRTAEQHHTALLYAWVIDTHIEMLSRRAGR